MDLKDKVVVITGGTKGLGKALADIFLERGSQVTVTSHESELADAKLYSIRSDVREEKDVKKLAEEVIQKYGHVDIWINNAGVFYSFSKDDEFVDMEKAQNIINTNFFGTVFGCRTAMKYMEKSKGGIIVNISSSAGLDATRAKNAKIYAASKWAVRGYTQALRAETQDSNVRVISVYPGGTKTELYGDQKPDNYEEFMNPEDVAEKIIANLELDIPEEEQILKRPK